MTMAPVDISATRPWRLPRWVVPVAVLVIAYGVLPFVGGSYLFEAVLTPFLALSLAAVGLNLLTGYGGRRLRRL
jgi:branched-chain amino acid transport system permease protein